LELTDKFMPANHQINITLSVSMSQCLFGRLVTQTNTNPTLHQSCDRPNSRDNSLPKSKHNMLSRSASVVPCASYLRGKQKQTLLVAAAAVAAAAAVQVASKLTT
jgi:hypothetical protein